MYQPSVPKNECICLYVPFSLSSSSNIFKPRIQTVVEIRPSKSPTFDCRSVAVELLTVQRVASPSALTSSETVKQTRVFADPSVYTPPLGQFSQSMLGLDVPILIPLDKNIVPSGYFDTWGATTVYSFVVRVTLGTSVSNEQHYTQEFPIPIKLYDTLPLYRQFNEPVCQSQVSTDKQVLVDVTLPTSAVGPQDTIDLAVRTAANHLYNKRKKNLQLKSVTLQLKEIFEGFDNGLPARKETKLFSETKTHESLLTTEGIEDSFSFVFPHENDLLELYSSHNTQDYSAGRVNHITASFNKNKNFHKLAEGVPLSHVQGFTIHGKLFALRYEFVLKVKLAHGKDIICSIPLTVSPYNRASSAYLMSWIMSECQVARDSFGRDAVADIVNCGRFEDMYRTTRRFCEPPVVYSYNPSDWIELGYNPDAFHTPRSDRRFVCEID
ncbi:hypothetical protein JCM33374_g4736 [Metschnikowia sp. JCM 33374]|nr:hypothetical protein JCM33374_g4736 [Metschnikowia sp. JCM 33374]